MDLSEQLLHKDYREEAINLLAIEKSLSQLLLGQKGGKNRIQIIELLRERPYNLNQLAEILNLNYRTIKHHVDVLLKNELVSTSKTGGYGEVYFLTPEMEGNIEIFEDILKKFEKSNKLKDFTESPKFFQSVMEQTHDAIVIIDKDGQIFFWNKSAEELFGYKEKEVMGSSLNIFADPKIQKSLISKAEKGEKIVDYEIKAVQKSGNLCYASITINCIRDDNEKIIGFSIFSRDITKHKQAEEELILSRERYALAQRAANIGSWDWDIPTGDLKWSETIEPMFGFGRGEFKATYEAFLECVHPDDRQFVIDSVNACLEDGKDYAIEHRIVWPEGTVRWVSESGDVIRDKNKKAIRMLGIVKDITEHKLMEKNLHDRTHELDERVKELNCLYGISKLVEKPDITLEEFIQETVELIPFSWQYPEITSARIVIDTKEFRAKKFKKTKWKQTSDIFSNGNKIGQVEVYYLEKRPELDEGPFQKEERYLLDTIASRLGKARDRMRAQERNKNLNDLLMAIKDIAQLINQETDLKILGQKSCDRLLNTKWFLDISISFMDDKKAVISQIGHSGEHKRNPWEITQDGKGRAPKCLKLVVKSASRSYIASTKKFCSRCRFCEHGDDHQSILIPILHQKSVVGALIICFEAAHEIDETENNLLEELASDLGFAYAKITTEKALRESQERYQNLFEDFPVSLWEEDFSDFKEYIDKLRSSGVKNFKKYFKDHPEEVANCANYVRIIDVNKNTLILYKAKNKNQLLSNLNKVFDTESYEVFREEIIALAEGKTSFESKAVTRTLKGDKIHIRLRLAVAPGYEESLSRVLVSIIDISKPISTN